ncbi:hypothetical protein KIPB_009645 [Kipferlia bialata]|uniref:Uncharacterized protein n=1 Tax=Kipferlia bialata TaxID=797122 RepID=A0A9K3D487_9EUKA|nr:hypothetical protein KIPB_009645 [Kipferlia bialata]|eukprot:g9645.t1
MPHQKRAVSNLASQLSQMSFPALLVLLKGIVEKSRQCDLAHSLGVEEVPVAFGEAEPEQQLEGLIMSQLETGLRQRLLQRGLADGDDEGEGEVREERGREAEAEGEDIIGELLGELVGM